MVVAASIKRHLCFNLAVFRLLFAQFRGICICAGWFLPLLALLSDLQAVYVSICQSAQSVHFIFCYAAVFVMVLHRFQINITAFYTVTDFKEYHKVFITVGVLHFFIGNWIIVHIDLYLLYLNLLCCFV